MKKDRICYLVYEHATYAGKVTHDLLIGICTTKELAEQVMFARIERLKDREVSGDYESVNLFKDGNIITDEWILRITYRTSRKEVRLADYVYRIEDHRLIEP